MKPLLSRQRALSFEHPKGPKRGASNLRWTSKLDSYSPWVERDSKLVAGEITAATPRDEPWGHRGRKGGGGFTPWKERGCRGDPMKRQLAEWKCNTRPHVTRKHAGGVVRAGYPLPLDDLWVRACVPRNCHFVNALLLAWGLSWGGAWERVTSSNWREDSSRRRLHAAWISGSALHLESLAPSVFWP